MNESDMSEGKTRVPAHQAQQPQPAASLKDQTQKLQIRAASENPGKNRASGLGSGQSAPKSGDGSSNHAIDDARFAAGVVKLYEALLKEPIPEEMLRLVNEIGKQERT